MLRRVSLGNRAIMAIGYKGTEEVGQDVDCIPNSDELVQTQKIAQQTQQIAQQTQQIAQLKDDISQLRQQTKKSGEGQEKQIAASGTDSGNSDGDEEELLDKELLDKYKRLLSLLKANEQRKEEEDYVKSLEQEASSGASVESDMEIALANIEVLKRVQERNKGLCEDGSTVYLCTKIALLGLSNNDFKEAAGIPESRR